MISQSITLTAEDFGKKTVILGKSGSGKSYTARVMIEEGNSFGVTFTVIDPQGAYENLHDFFYVDASKVSRPKDLGILLAGTAKNTVVSTKKQTITEQNKFLKEFLEGYRKAGRKGIRTIVIDECHKFAPEYDKTDAKEEVRSLSQENRSDGLGFIAIEQRSARLDKTVISQADYIIVHKLTSFNDLKSIEKYVDDVADAEKIKNLEVGQAFLYGFKEKAVVEKISKAKSKHSGESPKNLLTEDTRSFNKYIKKVYKGGRHMESVNTQNEPVKNVVPSLGGFLDLAGNGVKMSLGLGAAGVAGALASRFRSPIPMVSSRSLGSGVSFIGLYALYRIVKNDTAKAILGYAAAGNAVYLAGSLAYDGLAALKVSPPNWLVFAMSTMTGVSPVAVEGNTEEPGTNSDVDTNTRLV